MQPTYWISTEQDAGGKYMILVVLLKVVSDDEGRRHVDKAGAEAVHGAMREEQPLGRLYERRADEADRQHAGTEQSADAETTMTEHSNEAN